MSYLVVAKMFTELFLYVSLFLTVLSALVYKFKYAPIIEKSKNWPSLPSWPLIGSAHFFIKLSSDEILMYVIELLEMYHKDKCVKFWFGLELTFFVGQPKDVEIILTSPYCIEKSNQYSRLNEWLREGLLISKGKKWFQRRKLLTPAFHFSILKDYVEISENQSRIFAKKLKHYAESGKSFDIFQEGGLLALDVICETAMGVTIKAQANGDSEYVRAVKTLSKITHTRMLDVLHYYNFVHRFTKLAKEEKLALKIVHGFSEAVIQKRRADLVNSMAMAAKQMNSQEFEETGVKRKMSFLDLLLQSHIDGKPLTNIEIREEVDTFMFEGHDTTSSAISFFFYNMAKYPEYQQKCFDEILSVFGKDIHTPASYDELNKLHFIELCIKETLRLYPSVPIFGRKTTRDIVLSDGKIIPSGTNVGTMPLYVNRSEEHFPDANSFKPERFDVETTAEKINPFTYIPFSAGQRNCIGQKFALLELKTVALNVLRNFIVEYDGDLEKNLHLTGELILRTKQPLMLRVRERIY